MMVEESIKEEDPDLEDEIEDDEFLNNSISLEDLKQKFMELRQYTTSKEQEVKVLQSIIENKDEQILK